MTSPDSHPNAFHAVVHGRVQGVGYRVFARQSAQTHGITGWVRNVADGGVEVCAEGDEISLTEFLTDLYRGPVLSHVDKIDIQWEHRARQHDHFGILR